MWGTCAAVFLELGNVSSVPVFPPYFQLGTPRFGIMWSDRVPSSGALSGRRFGYRNPQRTLGLTSAWGFYLRSFSNADRFQGARRYGVPGWHPPRRRPLSPLPTSAVRRLASFPRLTVLESILWDLNHVLSIFCGGNLPRVLKTEIRGSRGRGIGKARSGRLRRLMRFPPRLSHFGKADSFWFHLSLPHSRGPPTVEAESLAEP